MRQSEYILNKNLFSQYSVLITGDSCYRPDGSQGRPDGSCLRLVLPCDVIIMTLHLYCADCCTCTLLDSVNAGSDSVSFGQIWSDLVNCTTVR